MFHDSFKRFHEILLGTKIFMMPSIQDRHLYKMQCYKCQEKRASGITLKSVNHEVNHRFSILRTSLYLSSETTERYADFSIPPLV